MTFAEVSTELRAWFSSILFPFVNLYLLLRNDRRSEKRNADMKTVVDKVEIQTNNITAELVKKTAKESHAAGLEAGRKEGTDKANALEAGRQQGRDESKT